MKALFIPEGDSYSVELLAESQEDRETLIKCWNHDSFALTCEEWREMSTDAQAKNG